MIKNNNFKQKLLITSISLAIGSASITAQATEWVTIHDGSKTNGVTGTATFDDWGFTGPNGRTAQDFAPVNGFGNNALDPTGGIGQIQHVVTLGPDGLTPDAPALIKDDIGSGGVDLVNANVDSMATFYQWGYTSPADSTFNNMQIDYDGDYHIAKDDMSFSFYNTLEYTQEGTAGSEADGNYANSLAFQPYALSDAQGWCGSIMADHPNALEAMAGQVTFDFAFDVYFRVAEGVYSYMSTEIVSGFEMRSYGDLTIDMVAATGDVQSMSARAVVNNTNPEDPMYDAGNTPTIDANMAVDENFHNKVSFMGGDVVTTGSDASGNTGDCGIYTADWTAGLRGVGVKKYDTLISGVADAGACTAAGGNWQAHAFSGYAFILRADAERVIDYFDESVYGPDPMSAVPVPAAVWLFGSGLLGLLGVARRKKQVV